MSPSRLISPTILPQFPAINTPVKVIVLVTCGNSLYKINISHTIDLQQNIINIYGCYYCQLTNQPAYLKDTVNLGLLPAGNYTLNFKTYRTSSPTVCVNKIDSTAIIDTSFTISSNVGINSNIKSNDFISIYPNPITDKLNIEFENSQEIKFSIMNSLGQVVYISGDKSPRQEIDLSFLEAGIYYLKIQSNSEQKTIKLIKQ